MRIVSKRDAVSVPLGERVRLAVKATSKKGARQHSGPGPTILEQRRIDASLKTR